MLLLFAAICYVAVHFVIGISAWFVLGALVFVAALVLLFLGEGSEVAVAMLMDKDPEQFEDFELPVRTSFENLWNSRRASPPPFIVGRQLIVIYAIVLITFISQKLTDIPSLDNASYAGAGGQVHNLLAIVSERLRARFVAPSFELLFPTFLALWIAQLPSKFMAHGDPVRTFKWILTRAIVSGSLVMGSRTYVEHISVGLTNYLQRFQRNKEITHLLPGRRSYYETSALLRGGRALEKAEIKLTIGADGAVSAHEKFHFHAFAEGLRKIPQSVFFAVPYASYEPVKFTQLPKGIREPKAPGFVRMSEKPEDAGSPHILEWDNIIFQSELPTGSDVKFELNYKTEAEAYDVGPGDDNDYAYNVNLVPTELLIVHIAPAPSAPFVLVELTKGPTIVVEASEEERINIREAQRVRCTPEDGGLRFEVRYPLLNSRFKFYWLTQPA
jgi:hypothetical protein